MLEDTNKEPEDILELCGPLFGGKVSVNLTPGNFLPTHDLDTWKEWGANRPDFPFRKQRAPQTQIPGLIDHHIAGRILRLVSALGRAARGDESIRREIRHRMLVLHPMCDEQDI